MPPDTKPLPCALPGALPYAHIRMVEFTHMVMGPTCGMVLADLGAEVIKVEPIGHGRYGDATRHLMGSGAGFFPLFNRNKKSLALDLETPAGKEAVLRLIATADIVSENFKPGTLKKLGLDYDTLKALNPRLIYISHKGFLPGPHDPAGWPADQNRADARHLGWPAPRRALKPAQTGGAQRASAGCAGLQCY